MVLAERQVQSGSELIDALISKLEKMGFLIAIVIVSLPQSRDYLGKLVEELLPTDF